MDRLFWKASYCVRKYSRSFISKSEPTIGVGNLFWCRDRASRSVQGSKKGRHRCSDGFSMHRSSIGRTASEGAIGRHVDLPSRRKGRLFHVRVSSAPWHRRHSSNVLFAKWSVTAERPSETKIEERRITDRARARDE